MEKEREYQRQDHHVGQRIQKRPNETENRVPVPYLEVLLGEDYYYVEVMTYRTRQWPSLPTRPSEELDNRSLR
jgi:hypothetical protein